MCAGYGVLLVEMLCKSDSKVNEDCNHKLHFVADETSKCPAILQQSQVPQKKRAKNEAIRKMVN